MIEACCLRSASRPNPKVSVLVRVKNERPAIEHFWKRLSSQSIFSSCEVVFLDSGSSDGTLEYLMGVEASVYHIAAHDFNFGSSCNLVMQLSSAPIAVFLSGHTLLSGKEDLENVYLALETKKCAALYLRQVPNTVLGANCYEEVRLARRYPASSTAIARVETPRGFSNAASALTRDAWEQNHFPDIHGSEDFEWARRHLSFGGSLFYMPSVQVMHSHPESPDGVFRRVKLNARAKGIRGSCVLATYYFVGVFFRMVLHGAAPREAWQYAAAHARGYLPEGWVTMQS
jgi:glycosyltransferase involved in cell wall biosynthesis